MMAVICPRLSVFTSKVKDSMYGRNLVGICGVFITFMMKIPLKMQIIVSFLFFISLLESYFTYQI